ncbi:2OG-Fe(II) oxygenase family protein, partial [Vibrio cholerae]|uniref:hypothetical protein n=1 Tax=Vibrio cholerae TaxID=666 RepID=UPI001F19F466
DDMDELGHWRRPAYDSGIGRGWQVTGPPHVRRFCQYVGPKDEEESASLQRSKLGRVGHLMRQLQHVIVSEAFVKRFLSHLNVEDKDAE